MGCYGTLYDGYLRLQGMIADMQGTQIFRSVEEGLADAAEAIGIRLADRLLQMGAAELIASQEK
jgi:hydroxymethylbilane synthase